MQDDSAEIPHITIEIKDNQVQWTSNMSVVSTLYYMDIVRHLILTKEVNDG